MNIKRKTRIKRNKDFDLGFWWGIIEGAKWKIDAKKEIPRKEYLKKIKEIRNLIHNVRWLEETVERIDKKEEIMFKGLNKLN